MSGPMAAVKAKVAATCRTENQSQLKAKGCSIDLTNAPRPHLIVNFDDKGSPLGNSDTRPDFLLISDTGGGSNEGGRRDPGLIAPVEMSTGSSKDAKKIKDQLQSGVNWLDNAPDGFQPTLLPVYCGSADKYVRAELRNARYKIKFRREKKTLKIISCGGKFPKPTHSK